jgi:hypothetical protein
MVKTITPDRIERAKAILTKRINGAQYKDIGKEYGRALSRGGKPENQDIYASTIGKEITTTASKELEEASQSDDIAIREEANRFFNDIGYRREKLFKSLDSSLNSKQEAIKLKATEIGLKTTGDIKGNDININQNIREAITEFNIDPSK